MDTLHNKIDSRILSDLALIKGPYTSRLGPGFSFVDAQLLHAQRFSNGYETHGSTSGDYKTNGEQFYARQSVWGGDQNWGFRVGYGHRGGSDYESGDGLQIPASYKWRDVDVAFGYDPTPTQHLDVHYLRLDQTDVELPGQFFDIDYLVTDAVEVHWVDEDPGFSDFLALEVWYNRTKFEGDSQRPAKRRQIPTLNNLDFFNTTAVDLMSTGDTVTSTWGEVDDPQLTVGTDLRFLKQEIQELNQFRARGFDQAIAALDPTFNATTVPALLPIPTGGTIAAGLPGALRLKFNSDLIFPFFRPSVDKFVPRSHSSNPGLFVEHLQPVGERLRFRAGARGDWVSANVEERRRFTKFDFAGILITVGEADLPKTPQEVQELVTQRPEEIPLQPLIPILQLDQVDLREELGENNYGLGSFYLT